MKKLIYIFIGILLLSQVSCKKDYLDPQPVDSFTELAVYNDLRLTESFLNIRYKEAFEKFPWIFSFSAGSDELYSQWNWFGEVNMVTGAVTPDQTFMDIWAPKFKEIRDLNTFLSKIDKVPGDSVFRNRQKGEAKFIRAYNYFDLLRRYGGVPLITDVLDPYNPGNIQRATYDQVSDFIVKECTDAAKLLPATYDDKNLGRVTKGAALALKARMLLYWASPHNNPTNDLARWTAAANAAKAVIDLKDANDNLIYELYQGGDYRNIFLVSYNSEIILCRTQAQLVDEDNNVDLINSPSGFSGWATYVPTQNLVDEFEMSNGMMIGETGSGYDSTTPYINRDKRFYANIIYDGCTYRGREVEHWVTKGADGVINGGGKDSPNGIGEYWNASPSGYCMRKYMEEGRNMFVGSAVKPVLFRITEMYLNYAEAENALGSDDVAREYLNYIRQRTSIQQPAVPSSISGITLRDKIRHERKIELLWENHRFFDVRRWNILLETGNEDANGMEITKLPDNTKTYKVHLLQERSIENKHYLLPIPKSELLRVDLPQNPEY